MERKKWVTFWRTDASIARHGISPRIGIPRFGIPLIGVASKKNSLLLKASDIRIVLPEVKEAGEGGFVPSSSTTMQLAFGDALALTLMNKKKLFCNTTPKFLRN